MPICDPLFMEALQKICWNTFHSILKRSEKNQRFGISVARRLETGPEAGEKGSGSLEIQYIYLRIHKELVQPLIFKSKPSYGVHWPLCSSYFIDMLYWLQCRLQTEETSNTATHLHTTQYHAMYCTSKWPLLKLLAAETPNRTFAILPLTSFTIRLASTLFSRIYTGEGTTWTAIVQNTEVKG